jgi:X-X-X-Leu-X-X-Gly heptad repeat protein
MASIDQKQKELQKAIADDEARIRGIREQRDVANIQGIGQLGAVGGQNVASGLQNLASGAGQLAEADLAGLFAKGGQSAPQVATNQALGIQIPSNVPNINLPALNLSF